MRNLQLSDRFRVLFLLVMLPLASLAAQAQAASAFQNPTSWVNPFYGSVLARPLSADPVRLSLDEAVQMGLQNNLGLKEAENDEKSLQGQKNVALQNFLPTITLQSDLGVHQQNLAAVGFGPGTLRKFAKLMGASPSATSGFAYVTKDDLLDGKVQYSQMLFSGPVLAAYRGARAAERAAHFGRTQARGEVVQQVASAYLRVLAASSEVDDARAREEADQVALNHAHLAHLAGTVANLDELRARVQLQAQQQAVIAAQNQLEKARILLRRETGLDPGQPLELTGRSPENVLETRTAEEIRHTAYENRQDFQKLKNQLDEFRAIQLAYKAQRLPSLSFGGYYAVSKVNGVASHGNFALQGNLSVPVFREAGLRGQIDTAGAQVSALDAQIADLTTQIDYQVRTALLDVEANRQLVQVSRSNVELATEALADETERVNSGVDDNLPLVRAQASLAQAQTSLVESLYQYNLSKLMLSRTTGLLETQYRNYLAE